MTGAPLRFGERAKVAEADDDVTGSDTTDAVPSESADQDEPERSVGGPPRLRDASGTDGDRSDADRRVFDRTRAERDTDDEAPSETAADTDDADVVARDADDTDAVDRIGWADGNGRNGQDVAPEPLVANGGAVVYPATPPKPRVAPTDLASMGRRERRQVAKRRARKVKRIVRRLDAWSVLKVAFIFNLCAYIVSMVAGVVLWRVADGAGVIENIESFIEDLGAFETYRFEPDLIFEAYALGGAVLAVLATGLIALAAVLFNLISDLVGGIRLTVIEEPGSLPARRRRSVGKGEKAPATVTGP